MSSCDFHVNLYSGILATPIILWDLAADVVLYPYSGIDATSTLLWDYAAIKAV
jgi:hypothetical protein